MGKCQRVETAEERETGKRVMVGPAPRQSLPPCAELPAPALSSVKSVAVVGNGPSAAGRGELIDSHDYVIRCNDWREAFPGGEAGTKADAVCLWPSCPPHTLSRAEIWMSTPRDGKKLPDVQVPARWVSNRTYMALRERLLRLHKANPNAHDCWPSTGLVALAMGLQMRSESLTLIGFDATLKSAPGWGEYAGVNTWLDVTGHDFVAEKKLIGKMVVADERIKWVRL